MRLLAVFFALIFMYGLGSAEYKIAESVKYKKVYKLERVTVIFADFETINEEYRKRGGKQKVYAFALPYSNIIYCSEWDFEACGHELHHLTHKSYHK